ncbi:unnamed protein product [Brassicogethes aeneus]|uniref:Homeotic protein ultrabithorax n=1 Tax=Brassicogethes aeneus TaxID=1431903 RepID=A0A9P0B6Y3_BRAAE|nr:unnamed protein product [Brassicogethes aeneus]
MNSYFEQSGFYGGHHHQGTGSVTGHHDQSAAAAAAYRSFPLSLGMSPYASSQHHHHHSLHQARPPQDSPYDASVAAACKLYSSSSDSQQNSINYSSSNTKPDCSKGNADQNGYASVVAAAAVKDVWQSATSGGGANLSNSLSGPVRPSACTPDSRVGYGSSVGLVGGDPSSSPGAASGGRTGNSLSSWNNPCSLNSSSSQPVGTQIHQQTNHTFYPWMAIAGEFSIPVVGGLSIERATDNSDLFQFKTPLVWYMHASGEGLLIPSAPSDLATSRIEMRPTPLPMTALDGVNSIRRTA